MSTGAVVLTTDGAPMNELIRPDCGMLIGVSESAETHAATKYLFGPQALGAAIAQLKSIPTSEKARMGQAAREWFLSNKAEFAPRFKAVIASCLKAGG